MKIRSMQAGGIVYTPFIPQQTMPQGQQVSGNESKSDKITGTIKKEVIDLLKENGLQNDVDETLNAAMSFLNQSSMLSNFAIFGGSNPDFSLAQLTQVQSLVNRTKRNKEQYDGASKVLTSENAWSDVAIDGRGMMYVLNENQQLQKISAKDYAENREKYQILDYSSLMHIREADPNLAFNQSILNDAGGAIGIQTISDYLIGIVKDFGKESETGYVQKLPQSVQDGLQALMAGGPDGYYKATSETEIKDINNAISYINDSMNQRMKATIDAYNVANGGEAGTKGRMQFIYNVLTNHTDTKLSVDFDSTATKAASGGSGSSSSESLVQESLAHSYSTGDGLGASQILSIVPADASAYIIASGRLAGPVVDKNENMIETTSLQSMLQKAEPLRSVVDAQSVTFGDQLIDPNMYDKIMFDSNTQMYRVWLPTKNVNGRIAVDFEAQEKAQALLKQIKQHGIEDEQTIAMLVEQNISGAHWDPNEKAIIFDSSKPFMTFGGYASSKEVDGLRDSKYLYNLPRDAGRQIKEKYNNLMAKGNIFGSGNDSGFGGKTRSAAKFYQGNIFIPITEGVAGAMIFDRQYTSKQTFTDITAKADMNNYLNQISGQSQNTQLRTNF